jgi:ATP-dependent Clp protease adaptor protein ClpS
MKCEMNKEYTAYLEEASDTQEPSLFQIWVHNDDFTPMEFVVGLLEKFFYMGRTKAAEVMLEAHVQGKAICGLFAKDFAEAKISQVVDYAIQHEQPLHCSMEAAE